MNKSIDTITEKPNVRLGLILLFGLVCLGTGLMWGGSLANLTIATDTLVIVGLLLVVGLILLIVQVKRLYNVIGRDSTLHEAQTSINVHCLACLSDLQFYTRSLVESNIDVIFAIDNAGNIFDANTQAELALGYQREELIGSSFKNYCTDAEYSLVTTGRILNEGKANNVELTLYAKNRNEIPFSCSAAVLADRVDKVIGIIISMRDITNYKKFEHLLEENNLELQNAMANAERASLAKSNFLSNMSHELRTPLNAILGFAQLMDTDEALPKATVKLSIQQILHGGWYLLDLINEILDLASIESGKVNLLSERISVSEVMSDCYNLIAQQAEKKNVQLIFPTPDIVDLYVKADQTRLKQVMINLLSNAIKYNRVDGVVNIRCLQKNNHVVQIIVEDTGHGMTPEQMNHLFEPFNRLGREGSSEDGTGIGLVVTRQLIQIMNGTMGVESVVGVGSTFWFELPSAHNAHSVPKNKSDIERPMRNLASGKGDKKKKMLYIEDNPVNLTLIEQLMSMRTDIKLLVATNGELGLQMARSSLPDLILLDINLPDMHGFELMKTLQADPATRKIPVIALSANAMQVDIERGLKAGCLHYLTKPINVKELMEKLDATLTVSETTWQAPREQIYHAL